MKRICKHILLLSLLALLPCSVNASLSVEQVSAIIIGSAEHPDPVLVKVRELEKKGILKNVIVMESFAVHIKVTGPKDVIKSLQDMPRKVLPSFN